MGRQNSKTDEELSLLNPDAYEQGCPHARITQLRTAAPVSWQPDAFDPSLVVPDVRGGWFVHRYEDVCAVLRDTKTFSSQRMTAILMDLDADTVEAMSNMLLNMDPPMHGRYRRLVAAAFTPRRVADLEPRIREIAKDVITAVAKRGECDAVMDVAAPMPMTVIAELLGIPERSAQLFEISNRMVGAVEVDDPTERAAMSVDGGIEIQLLGHELAAEKRAAPDDSLMSAYVNGGLTDLEGEAHEGCTDEEVGWFLLLLAVAGNETVRTATGQSIRIFADHPEQRDLLTSDIEQHLPGAVEEVLRYSSPVRALRRTSTVSTDVGGTRMEEDAKVVCHFSSALRDERVFENPDRFDITREMSGHQLAFGYGEHYCLGASLARVQLKAILREIYSRIPDIRPVGPMVPQPTPLLEAMLSLPVEFTPEN